MQIGACGGFDTVQDIQAAGFDYIEMSVSDLLVPNESDAIFTENLTTLHKCGLPCPTVNCFIPGDLKICGPEVNKDALYKYAETVIRRASEAGVQVVVFGSGGARQIPEGFDRGLAWLQIKAFARFTGETGAIHNVTIVLEPLNAKECNLLNNVAECARLVHEVRHPSFRLLVDSYHWGIENESTSDICANISIIKHIHAATWPNRLAPGRENCAMEAFFSTLSDSGYNGRISFEGKIEDLSADLKLAHEIMREFDNSHNSNRQSKEHSSLLKTSL